MEPITIDFWYTRKDLVKAKVFFDKFFRAKNIQPLIISALFLLAGIAGAIKTVNQKPETIKLKSTSGSETIFVTDQTTGSSILVPSILIAFGLVSIVRTIDKSVVDGIVKKYPQILCSTELSILPDGILTKRKGVEYKTAWEFIQLLYEQPEFLAIIDKENRFKLILKKYVEPEKYEQIKNVLKEKIKNLQQ